MIRLVLRPFEMKKNLDSQVMPMDNLAIVHDRYIAGW